MAGRRLFQSPAQIRRQLVSAQADFARVGLLTKKLLHIPLVTPVTDLEMDLASGAFFVEDDLWMRLWGYRKGSIAVPLVSLQSGVLDRFTGRQEPLLHTLRHELGHALAYLSPRRVIRDDPAFHRAFFAGHDDGLVTNGPDWEDIPYERLPCERFAEAVAAYVRARGRPRPKTREARREAAYVATLPRKLERAGLVARI